MDKTNHIQKPWLFKRIWYWKTCSARETPDSQSPASWAKGSSKTEWRGPSIFLPFLPVWNLSSTCFSAQPLHTILKYRKFLGGEVMNERNRKCISSPRKLVASFQKRTSHWRTCMRMEGKQEMKGHIQRMWLQQLGEQNMAFFTSNTTKCGVEVSQMSCRLHTSSLLRAYLDLCLKGKAGMCALLP